MLWMRSLVVFYGIRKWEESQIWNLDGLFGGR